MRIMRRRLLGAIALSTAAVLAAGCGGGGDTGGSGGGGDKGPSFNTKVSGTVNAWGFDNADEVGTSRVDYAKQQLKSVTLKMDKTPFDAQKFSAKVASGSVPDVVQMDASLVATYAASNLIMPLDQCFSAHKVNPQSTFYPAVNADISYQGKIWAIPQFYQPPAIILNKRVLDETGVTADQINTSKPDQLLAAIKKMYQAKGGNPSRLGFDPVATGQTSLWILGYGGQLIDKSGKPTLNDPRNVKGLQVLKQITDAQGGFAKVKSFSDSFDVFGDGNQYVKDQVGAQVNAQWYPNVLSEFKDKIKVQAVPFKDNDGNAVSVTGGSSFVIPAKAKNPDAACAWIIRLTDEQNWMAAEKARVETLKKNGGINTGLFTGSPKADQDIKAQYVKPSGDAGFDQVIETTYQVLDGSKSLGATPVGQQIQNALTSAITSTLLGQKSAKDALKNAQQVAMNAWNQTKH
jgi:multiple sugar transport system substrate-binding protein